MKIAVTNKRGSGMMLEFARAIGATVRERFVYIPASKGGGYLTGFSWGSELRMMLRHYHLNEDVLLEWTTDELQGQDDVVFLLRGIFPPAAPPPTQVLPEPPSVFIARQAASVVIAMPANTLFNSVTIAVARPYLRQLFGELAHPLVVSLLEADDTLALETGISPEMVSAASDLLRPPVPESLASLYYRLKCEELLCHTLTLLMQREAVPPSKLHLADLKALYAIKLRLQSSCDQAPAIAALAQEAGMSAPKLRKLFKQTFGQGIFAYYQAMRMQQAARLLQEKHLSVAEVGYQLGFTNLSHFARVFEQHFGLKPKKYSAL